MCRYSNTVFNYQAIKCFYLLLICTDQYSAIIIPFIDSNLQKYLMAFCRLIILVPQTLTLLWYQVNRGWFVLLHTSFVIKSSDVHATVTTQSKTRVLFYLALVKEWTQNGHTKKYFIWKLALYMCYLTNLPYEETCIFKPSISKTRQEGKILSGQTNY